MGSRGFSLVELMIVMLVVGIVLAAGLPAYSRFRDDMLVGEARAQLLQDLRVARQTAVTWHCPVIIAFGNGSTTTNVSGYTVHMDTNANGSFDSGERRFSRTMPSRTLLATVALQPTDSLVFDLSGVLRLGTAGGSMILVTPRGQRDTLFVSAAGVTYAP